MTFDNLAINFDGSITGAGEDTNGAFTISGTLNGDSTFSFNKAYESYTVCYKGTMEGNVLKGMWNLEDNADEDEFKITLSGGNWKGFFEQGGDKNKMKLSMGVSGGAIFGCGSDAVGGFVLRGQSGDDGTFNFVKKYLGQHEVLYFGKSNGGDGSRVVKGKWTIVDTCEGTFGLKEC